MTKARRPESALRYSLLELNHLGNKWIYLVQTQGKYNLWIIILVASSSELNMCLVLNLHGRFILQLSLLILLLVVTTIGWHGASTLHHLLSLTWSSTWQTTTKPRRDFTASSGAYFAEEGRRKSFNYPTCLSHLTLLTPALRIHPFEIHAQNALPPP